MKPSDVRGKPGDLVMVRGKNSVVVWNAASYEAGSGDSPRGRSGLVLPGSIGVIISLKERGHTMVLWSMPAILGWVSDGLLQTVKL